MKERNYHKMTECIIPIRTPTLASKAERTLALSGIHSTVVNIDPSVTKRGCGYGVKLSCRDAERSLLILEKKHVPCGELIGGGMYDIS